MSLLQGFQNSGLDQFYAKWILPRLRDKKTLGVAVALTALYSLHQSLTTPPRSLRHLPHIGFYKFFRAMLSNATVDEYSKEICLPILIDSPKAHVRYVAGFWAIRLTDPLAIKQFISKPEIFPKSELTSSLPGTLMHRFVGGSNVLMTNGENWKRQRKIVTPAFNKSMPVQLFGELTLKMFELMDNQDSIELTDLFSRYTIQVLGQAGFGFDFKAMDSESNEWIETYESIKNGMIDPFFLALPRIETRYLSWFPKRKQLHHRLTHFKAMLTEMIDQRRAERSNLVEHERDLLTLMIESEEQQNDAKVFLTDDELLRNLCIFFIAGHDTTAAALAFMMYELAINPDIQEKARQEAQQVLGDDPLPTLEHMKKMTYINAMIKETMRLHSPAVNLGFRTALEDCYLNDIFIPKGSLLTADILCVHRNPQVWVSPFKFNPDRFLPGGEAESQSGLAWMPFSSGGRICVGMNFSVVEQRVVISMLLRKYKWKLPQDSRHKGGLRANGLGFGIVSTSDLKMEFEKII